MKRKKESGKGTLVKVSDLRGPKEYWRNCTYCDVVFGPDDVVLVEAEPSKSYDIEKCPLHGFWGQCAKGLNWSSEEYYRKNYDLKPL